MQENKNRRLRPYRYYSNKKLPHFEVTSYLNNPDLIKNLHNERKEAIEWAKRMEDQLDLAQEQIERIEEYKRQLELEKQKLEIGLAGATTRVETLDREKKEIQAEVKSLIDQLAAANADIHGMRLQNKELELELKNVHGKLEIQVIEVTKTHTRCHVAEGLVNDLQVKNHQMELEKERLEAELRTIKEKLEELSQTWRTFPQYVVTLVATAILSFGISMVASSLYSIFGWAMVIVGVILEIVAFVVTLISRPKRIVGRESIANLERVTEPERVVELKKVTEPGRKDEPERTAENE